MSLLFRRLNLLNVSGATPETPPLVGNPGGGDEGDGGFTTVATYAENADLEAYLQHNTASEVGRPGERFDPGLPTNSWFDNVHYVAPNGASSGDGLTVGAPVNIQRAWAIARTHRSNAESGVFYLADGNYVSVDLGGINNYIPQELTDNRKPILFIGSGTDGDEAVFVGTGSTGEPLYLGGAYNFHLWRWSATNPNKSQALVIGMAGFRNNDTAGPLVDCTLRWAHIHRFGQSILEIKHDCENLVISDTLIETSGLTQRTTSNQPYCEAVYHGHNDLDEGFHPSVGGDGTFRGFGTQDIPCFTGPQNTWLVRCTIRDIWGGEAVDNKVLGNVNLFACLIHNIEPYYTGAIACHITNPQFNQAGQQGYTMKIHRCVISDVRNFSLVNNHGGTPAANPWAIQVASSIEILDTAIFDCNGGIGLGYVSSHPSKPALMEHTDNNTAATVTIRRTSIWDCSSDDFDPGTGWQNYSNHPHTTTWSHNITEDGDNSSSFVPATELENTSVADFTVTTWCDDISPKSSNTLTKDVATDQGYVTADGVVRATGERGAFEP